MEQAAPNRRAVADLQSHACTHARWGSKLACVVLVIFKVLGKRWAGRNQGKLATRPPNKEKRGTLRVQPGAVAVPSHNWSWAPSQLLINSRGTKIERGGDGLVKVASRPNFPFYFSFSPRKSRIPVPLFISISYRASFVHSPPILCLTPSVFLPHGTAPHALTSAHKPSARRPAL